MIYIPIDWSPGPVHSPLFRVTVEVNGQMFEGQAISKKKAKLDVAEKALASFVQLPNASLAAKALPVSRGLTIPKLALRRCLAMLNCPTWEWEVFELLISLIIIDTHLIHI